MNPHPKSKQTCNTISIIKNNWARLKSRLASNQNKISEDRCRLLQTSKIMSSKLHCDSELFASDQNTWMGKVAFQSILASAIRKQHLSSASIDPSDILNQVEVLWLSPEYSMSEENMASRTVGQLLFDHIGSVWKGDDLGSGPLYDLLTPLILKSIERSKKEKIQELEARSLPRRQNENHPPQGSVAQIDEKLGVNMSGGGVGTGAEPTSVPFPTPTNSTMIPRGPQMELHRYTSLILEYAQQEKMPPPEYKKSQLSSSPLRWCCIAQLGSYTASGNGSTYKIARHEANRSLFNIIGLTAEAH